VRVFRWEWVVTVKQRQGIRQKEKQTDLVDQMYQTITHHFPLLFDWLREVEDCRKKKSTYELAALLTACISMSLFKATSRNGLNNLREDMRFKKNYKRLFKLPLPHMDTVDRVMRCLKIEQIEQLKQKMVQTLLRQKVFHKQRYRDRWFTIAIDGTGVHSFDEQHCDQCLHKTSKKENTTWMHHVLEARLVTGNGFSVSLMSEWIENPVDQAYDKQDCERKAFTRLATRLKQAFPRLPILILADGLYPYEGFFALCKAHDWRYIVTFKEGNLTTIWEEVSELQVLQHQNRHREQLLKPDQSTEERHYCWVTGLTYRDYSLHWLECRETIIQKNKKGESKTTHRIFTHLTDLPINARNIVMTSQTGRLRWKIENEGFNSLKNEGYALEHKFSRVSYQASKNYYQFIQIAHLINQLMTLSTHFRKSYLNTKNHPTFKSLWKSLIAAMQWAELDVNRLQAITEQKIQFRYSP